MNIESIVDTKHPQVYCISVVRVIYVILCYPDSYRALNFL